MRTGNAFFALTFRIAPQPEVRLTLLDAGEEAVAEISIPDAPWEESANVPVEPMSAFRTAVEELPETWPRARMDGDAFAITAQFEIAGKKGGFEARYATPEDVPEPQRQLFTALAAATGAALVGGRSRKAIEALARWGA